ncbi:hypothetical protein BD410DRAFT_784085 [Rickenella mellea]|uniref:Uncharacterized protein n=1 Tax=Rickenella mellea TaxID=50990 RepID=A0A4Y7QFM9_9AGAM|nr:hypothetical protein BD410DRAFT_784085 [Rickenella mellea]
MNHNGEAAIYVTVQLRVKLLKKIGHRALINARLFAGSCLYLLLLTLARSVLSGPITSKPREK